MVNQRTKIDSRAVSVAGMPITETSAAIRQAFADWNEHRAYLDNGGNYRVKRDGGSNGPIALWNKEVKRLFADSGEFHRAAREWKERGEL